jgi:gliding motility-associated-like protein
MKSNFTHSIKLFTFFLLCFLSFNSVVAQLTPLTADFSYTSACHSGDSYQEITFTSTTTGGQTPYAYVWLIMDTVTLLPLSIPPAILINNTLKYTPTTSHPIAVYLKVIDFSDPKVKDDYYEIITPSPCCGSSAITAMTTSTICSGGTFTVTPLNGINGTVPTGTTYSWSAPTVAGITGTTSGTNATNISGTLTNTTSAPINVVYTVTPKSGSCVGSTFTVTVKVTAKPGPILTCATTKTICSGTTIGHALTSSVPATYSWVAVDNPDVTGESISPQTSAILTDVLVNTTSTVQTVIYTVTPTTSTAICLGTAQTIIIKIYPSPICSITGPDGPLLPSSTGNNYTAPTGMSSYTWSVSGNATINGSSSTKTVLINVGAGCGVSFTLTLHIKDLNGCESICTKVITVEDTVEPTFTKPADITIYTDTNCHYVATPIKTGSVTNEHDNCSTGIHATYVDVITPGTCTGSHIITRTWSLVDVCGNKAPNQIQIITVKDNTAPTFTKPADITIYTDASCGYNATLVKTGDVTNEHDNCSTGLQATYADAITNGNCAGAQTINRTWSLMDACGNKAPDQVQIITIEDNISPTITQPAANIIVQCNGQGNNTALTNWLTNHGGATASDNCSTVTWTNNFDIITKDCSAPVTVEFTATDACGNKTITSATYTIDDKIAPTITQPAANLIVQCDGQGNNTALTSWLNNHAGATASDNCSTVTWTNNFDTITKDCSAAVPVEFTATDACGNKTITSATFTIDDKTAPTWTNQAGTLDTTIECSDAQALTTAQANTPLAADNCDGDLSNIVKTSGAFIPSGTCTNTGTYTNTWTVKDDCGNTSDTFTQVITIKDTTAPTWTTVAGTLDATVECSDANALTTAQANAPVAIDNCDGDVTNITKTSGAFVATSGACGNAGTYTNTWTVKDDCGNTSETFTQVITIQDTTAPTWTTAIGTLDATLECSDANALTTAQGKTPTANDNCDGDVTNITKTSGAFVASGACGNGGTYTNTWTVTDDCGNTSETFTQVITIQGTTTLTWTTAAGALNATLQCSDADALATAQADAPLTTDNCNVATTITKTSGQFIAAASCSSTGTYTNTWVATDICGNTTGVFTQVITIEDTTKPTFNGELPADLTVSCNQVPQPADMTATDNCNSDVPVVYSETKSNIQNQCSTNYTLTRKWSTSDCVGNTTTYTQVITVKDTTGPTGTVPADIALQNIADIPVADPKAVLNATDNCSATVTVTVSDTNNGGTGCASTPYIVTRTYALTDCAGNKTLLVQTITVKHDNPITTAATTSACNADPSTVNLFNILPRSTTTAGTWVDTNNTHALNGNIVTSFGLAVGTYSFEYQIKDEACPRSLIVNLVINDDCQVLAACGDILVHNAFSPNGDNRNDKFVIDNIDNTTCYPENTIEIYNRWGILVYETKNYNNTTNAFDGFSRGRTTVSESSGLPSGTYFYILNYTAVDGNGAIQPQKQDGYIYLSR